MDDRLLPQPSTLHLAPKDVQQSVLTRLFEHSQRLHIFAAPLHERPYPTYHALIDELKSRLISLAPASAALVATDNAENVATLDAILKAHPRLGENKAILSGPSAVEQAKLQGGDDEEAAQLRALNAQYESIFGGLRYLVFVNGRDRPAIFEDMRRRIRRGDPWEERMEGITAMCEIAKDRVKKIGVAQ